MASKDPRDREGVCEGLEWGVADRFLRLLVVDALLEAALRNVGQAVHCDDVPPEVPIALVAEAVALLACPHRVVGLVALDAASTGCAVDGRGLEEELLHSAQPAVRLPGLLEHQLLLGAAGRLVPLRTFSLHRAMGQEPGTTGTGSCSR